MTAECTTTEHAPDVRIVVSRYAEDLWWLAAPNFRGCDIVVYDKNDGAPDGHGNPPAGATVIPLPNVGREAHTYLHHILENYDALAGVTVFAMGSAAENPEKMAKTAWSLRTAIATRDSAFPDEHLGVPMHEHLGSFVISSYPSSSPSNVARNPDDALLPCPHRPFGKWYAVNELPAVHSTTYHGTFAVSRAHIRQRSKADYARLLAYVDGHPAPEAAHYLERAWLAVFHPIPRSCLLSWSRLLSALHTGNSKIVQRVSGGWVVNITGRW